MENYWKLDGLELFSNAYAYLDDVYPLIFHPVSDHLYALTYPYGTITVDAREWVLKATEKEIEDMAQDVIVQAEREEKTSLILYFCIEKHLFCLSAAEKWAAPY